MGTAVSTRQRRIAVHTPALMEKPPVSYAPFRRVILPEQKTVH